ncbi:DUF47 family protein [Candidatus Giovannonibacteria bacterium]|nr:DUF47 family protein [Candidatus Giovannonibacteria bacterium]
MKFLIFDIFNLHGPGMVELYRQHAACIARSIPILETLINENMEGADETIQELEHECDAIASKLEYAIENTFPLPFDCEELHELISSMDDIMDNLEEAVIKLVDYRFTPDRDIKELLKKCSNALGILEEGVACLGDRNKSRASKKFCELRGKMKNIEKDCDVLERQIIRESYYVPPEETLTLKYSGVLSFIMDRKILQQCFTEYNNLRKRREVAECIEDTVDMCWHVFHIIKKITLKWA